MSGQSGRLAILWRGDREARNTAKAQTSRFHRVLRHWLRATFTWNPQSIPMTWRMKLVRSC